MTNKKSIKTSAEHGKSLLKILKENISDEYFLEVLYFYIRRALIRTDFNLQDISGIKFNGRYLGHELKVDFSTDYDTITKSLGLLLSIRVFMLDSKYLYKCYNDELLFNDLDSNYLTWHSHKAVLECMEDEDFKFIYDNISYFKDNHDLSDEFISQFKSNTKRPEYRNQISFCMMKAADPDYNGKSIIKNSAYLYADFDSFTVPENVDYIGDTAFAYCNNLETITFTQKVYFGYFPIIECNKLRQIIVPTALLDYYKQELPHYKDIISDVAVTDAIASDIPQVDTDILWTVFNKKATSYKYFWFLAIMDIYINRKQITIPYKNIVVKMAAKAWKYWFVDKYSFGKMDQLGSYLNIILDSSDSGLSADSSESKVEEYILENYGEGYEGLLGPLLKNVPYRFLSPWIPFTTTSEVIEKSNDPEAQCLYALKDDSIVLNERWLGFIKQNADKVNDFAKTELKKYLEPYNR